MKRQIACTLALAMALSLAACSGGTEASGATGEAGTPNSTSQEAAPTPEPTPEPVELFPGRATIEETVLADTDDFTITANSLTYEQDDRLFPGSVSPVLHLTLENKSDRELTFSDSYSGCYVNGCVGGPDLLEKLEAGQSAQADAILSTQSLYLAGITDIGEITLSFSVRGEEYSDSTYTEPVTIQTSLAGSENGYSSIAQSMQDADLLSALGATVDYLGSEPMYDNGLGISINSEAIVTLSSGARTLLLETVNSGDAVFSMDIYHFEVNNITLPYSAVTDPYLDPGTRAVIQLPITESATDPINQLFSEISTISAQMIAYNNDLVPYEDTFDPPTYTLNVSDTPAEVNTSGDVLFTDEANGVRILNVAREVMDNSTAGSILLLIENTGDQDVCFSADRDNILCNGQPFDAYVTSTIADPGQYGVVDIWLNSVYDIGLNSSSEVTSMEIPFELYHYRMFEENETFASGTITLNY